MKTFMSDEPTTQNKTCDSTSWGDQPWSKAHVPGLEEDLGFINVGRSAKTIHLVERLI